MNLNCRTSIIGLCNLFILFLFLVFHGCGEVDPEIEKKIDERKVKLEKLENKLNTIEDKYEELNEANLYKREKIAEHYSKIMTSKLQLRKISSNKEFPSDVKTLVKVL